MVKHVKPTKAGLVITVTYYSIYGPKLRLVIIDHI